MQKEYKTISEISGPLVFVKKTEPVSYGELVQIAMPDGTTKRGQVLDTSKDVVVVQIFEGTAGIDMGSGVKFLGETFKLSVSKNTKLLDHCLFFTKFRYLVCNHLRSVSHFLRVSLFSMCKADLNKIAQYINEMLLEDECVCLIPGIGWR